MEWVEVLKNPLLRNLPFKIELNRFGTLMMRPVSNRPGRIQASLVGRLINLKPDGEIITECSIQTSDGVKVADVVWASKQFITAFGYETPYLKAPELCVEIVSPSNSKQEIETKVDLYLAKGAKEVWVVQEEKGLHCYTHTGLIDRSVLVSKIHEEKDVWWS